MSTNQRFQWNHMTAGVCYYPEHWPRENWASDLDRMLDAGISVVRSAEFSWVLLEPSEGTFSFDLFDSFLDLCAQKGMKVILGTPTATPPAWLTEKYPEVLNCDITGTPYRHGGRRHYTYNSPVYQKLCSRIVEEMGQRWWAGRSTTRSTARRMSSTLRQITPLSGSSCRKSTAPWTP